MPTIRRPDVDLSFIGVPPRFLVLPTRWRRNVTQMTAGQLAAFRSAMTQAQAISDDRGFANHAGIHGLPLPSYCQHGTDLFLPWHRAYLYYLERALRDFVPGIAHPYWDWTRTHAIPPAYGAAQDPDGAPNPLHHGTLSAAAFQQAQQSNFPPVASLPAETFRRPGPAAALPTTTAIDDLLEISDFFTFSNELESIHGGLHGWVGGHMSWVPTAAFDPIFWAHHAQVDRLWRMWQLRHPPPTFSAEFLSTPLPPFPMTVAQTLDVRQLGYDYATSIATVRPLVTRPVVNAPPLGPPGS